MTQTQHSSDGAATLCPATQAVKIIGGRWKLNIMYNLQRQIHRYSDLQRCLPEVTPKMLTQPLRKPEENGIVHREVYRQVPPKSGPSSHI